VTHTLPATGTLALQQVYRLYELVDSGDAAGVADLHAADAVYHRPGYEPRCGREAVFWFYQRDRIIASGQHQIQQAVADHHQVAVHGRFTGLLHDGTAVDLRFADFFSFDRSGLVCERRTFYFTHTV
jgi:ketosteroid isomerase-like protein